MLKLFNKVKLEIKSQDLKPITSKEIQDEMHKELRFLLENNQIEVITNEVTAFKEKNRHILTKADRLASLGFVNTPSIVVKQQLSEQIKSKEKQLELEETEVGLTQEYALEFPGYKFVPDRIFTNVKEKYDLYTASPNRYIKEIPEKNLSEIEAFLPAIKDTHEFGYVYRGSWSRGEDWNVSQRGTEQAMRERLNNYEKVRLNRDGSFSRNSPNFDYQVRKRTDLFEITAPISHFNLEDSEIKDRTIRNKRPVEDPIVSHKVRGGYIIVTVWDKEAEIPEIQNPINN